MNRFTITPDTEPEEIKKLIQAMWTGDVARIQEYGYTKEGGIDENTLNIMMIVRRIVGGWIYEVMADGDGQLWQPVFVPEQAYWARMIQEGINSALDNLPQGFIPVRQS